MPNPTAIFFIYWLNNFRIYIYIYIYVFMQIYFLLTVLWRMLTNKLVRLSCTEFIKMAVYQRMSYMASWTQDTAQQADQHGASRMSANATWNPVIDPEETSRARKNVQSATWEQKTSQRAKKANLDPWSILQLYNTNERDCHAMIGLPIHSICCAPQDCLKLFKAVSLFHEIDVRQSFNTVKFGST